VGNLDGNWWNVGDGFFRNRGLGLAEFREKWEGSVNDAEKCWSAAQLMNGEEVVVVETQDLR
jgi:hypothetical protein